MCQASGLDALLDGVAVVLFSQLGQETPAAQSASGDGPPTAPPSILVRWTATSCPTAADGKVTVGEFLDLDLECEACGAASRSNILMDVEMNMP